MALAIRFDSLIRRGDVTDQVELARLGHVSRARLTQIMNLRLLAPDSPDELPTALFDRLDSDKNGFVTEEELKLLWRTKQ